MERTNKEKSAIIRYNSSVLSSSGYNILYCSFKEINGDKTSVNDASNTLGNNYDGSISSQIINARLSYILVYVLNYVKNNSKINKKKPCLL
jgi:hypothetical protein